MSWSKPNDNRRDFNDRGEPKFAAKVTERFEGRPIRAEIVPIEIADEDCRNPCGHIGVCTEDLGFLYDAVLCAKCGKSLYVS